MLSIQIYLVGSIAITLIILFLSDHIITNYHPNLILQPSGQCIPTRNTNQYLCAVCLNHNSLPPIEDYGWSIQSNGVYSIATFRQPSYLSCAQFLQTIDSDKYQRQNQILLQKQPAIEAIGLQAGFGVKQGKMNASYIQQNFTQLVIIELNNVNHSSQIKISTPNQIACQSMMTIIQSLSLVGIGFAGIILLLYRVDNQWLHTFLSFTPSVCLLIILSIIPTINFHSSLLLFPLISYYIYVGHYLKISLLPIVIPCLLFLFNVHPYINLSIQLLLSSLFIFYHYRQISISKIFFFICTATLIINSYYLRTLEVHSLSVRNGLIQTILVIFAPSLMELQRTLNLGKQTDKTHGSIQLGQEQLEEHQLQMGE